MPDEPAIEVRGLRKSYGAAEAVAGVDLRVLPGEVFGLLGTNGAGKTTIIEILEGYRRRSAGEVSVLGRDPERPTREWRDRIGLVLQESELDPVYTVRETVALFAAFSAHPRGVDETIDLVGLAGRGGARIGRLSGGQRRRVDVALALINDPDLVFLDEPTTGFDPAARRGAWAMIEGLAELGKTVLLTTHYMDEAEHLSDRVAILHGGRMVAEGRPAELGATLRAAIVFQRPDGVAIESISAAAGAPFAPDGPDLVCRVAGGELQGVLHRLLAWAASEGVTLQGLSVRRPSLEDTFLSMTADEPTGAEHA